MEPLEQWSSLVFGARTCRADVRAKCDTPQNEDKQKIKLPPSAPATVRNCTTFSATAFSQLCIFLSNLSRNHENLVQRPPCSRRPPRNGEHPTGLGCLLLGTRQHGDECRLRRLLSERTDILHQRQWHDHLPVPWSQRWSLLELWRVPLSRNV